MTCGWMLWGAFACQGLLHACLYRLIRSRYQSLYDELNWTSYFSATGLTGDTLWLLLFGHWKYKSALLSGLCVGILFSLSMFVLAMTQTTCSGGFALW
jgi:hypothetical protein